MTSFNQFKETIGEAGAVILLREFAGKNISVPGTLPPGHPLEVLGVHAPALCYHFGGSRLYVPFQRHVERRTRDQAIASSHKQGQSVSALAQEYGMCERSIWKILRKQRILKNLENRIIKNE